jgi:hypothetical protein
MSAGSSVITKAPGGYSDDLPVAFGRQEKLVDPQETGGTLNRRSALKRAGVAVVAMSGAAMFEQAVVAPIRPAFGATPTFSDIQFDIGRFIAPATTVNDGAGNVTLQFGPVFSLILPAKLNRTPSRADQTTLANALNTIEANFAASPAGVLITSVSYGVPYFNRLPRALVTANIPKLSSNTARPVLEEAVAGPTDVVGGVVGGPNALIPGQKKDRFNVNVVIEQNDVLLHFRSDSMSNLTNVLAWLQGSNTLNGRAVTSPAFANLFAFQTPRIQFVQRGMPKTVASNNGLEFASRINSDSPMAMGFTDQQADSSGPAAICTFVGTAAAKLTTARAGDYFDNGSIVHLSHVIQDLYQFYTTPNQDANRPDGEPYQERIQYMFRSNQLGTANGIPSEGNSDQFTNGGGPAFVSNVFQGNDTALAAARDGAGQFTPANTTLDATFTGLGRIGHEAALQQVSRASNGTPLHIRMDGPGFDGMDVPAFTTFPTGGQNLPAGTNVFKLQFLMFVPTADLFNRMRVAQGAQQLQHQFLDDDDEDNGLERFITATRRQNFLVPPRRHRAFPLVELA